DGDRRRGTAEAGARRRAADQAVYDTLLQIRDVKKQAAEIAQKADARTRMEAAAKALTEKLVAIEGDITQLQGEGGQDALNFPGRIDNQWVALYGNVANAERKLNKAD